MRGPRPPLGTFKPRCSLHNSRMDMQGTILRGARVGGSRVGSFQLRCAGASRSHTAFRHFHICTHHLSTPSINHLFALPSRGQPLVGQ